MRFGISGGSRGVSGVSTKISFAIVVENTVGVKISQKYYSPHPFLKLRYRSLQVM